jgi:hypothetical protein
MHPSLLLAEHLNRSALNDLQKSPTSVGLFFVHAKRTIANRALQAAPSPGSIAGLSVDRHDLHQNSFLVFYLPRPKKKDSAD